MKAKIYYGGKEIGEVDSISVTERYASKPLPPTIGGLEATILLSHARLGYKPMTPKLRSLFKTIHFKGHYFN